VFQLSFPPSLTIPGAPIPKALVKLMQAVSGEKPKLWGQNIIGFGRITMSMRAAAKETCRWWVFHRASLPWCSIWPGSKAATALLAKLGKHTSGKSCLYIKQLADVDLKILQELIVRSIAAAKAISTACAGQTINSWQTSGSSGHW
jgi:hypothetical protein